MEALIEGVVVGAGIRALMHLLLYVGPVRLGFNDTVVMSMGLHYHNAGSLVTTMQTIFEWWAKEHAAGRAPRLLWRETSPQHFATQDGRFHISEDIVTTRRCRENLIAPHRDYPDQNLSRLFVGSSLVSHPTHV
jgi:hypothetical protein